jgi:elongation factor Ts
MFLPYGAGGVPLRTPLEDAMAEITASSVKNLREKTGAGMMECKKALEEAGGDEEKAVTILRERGKAAATKKQARIAAEGLVESYIHMGGRIGVLVEVNCETDFVARGDDFRNFVRDVALQICALDAQYVSADEIPAEALEKEREIARAQVAGDPKMANKPENIIANIIESRVGKFKAEVCLMEQPFVKDQGLTVNDLLKQMIAKTGENIRIRRFVRFKMGEGLEKKQDDFAAEVAALQN